MCKKMSSPPQNKFLITPLRITNTYRIYIIKNLVLITINYYNESDRNCIKRNINVYKCVGCFPDVCKLKFQKGMLPKGKN